MTAIMDRRLITICVPVYNEELNIDGFHDRIRPVLDALGARYDFEILFSDNHSEDSTFEKLVALSNRDRRVRVIRFSRNFGFQRSILSNYMHARGDAAIQIDVDLQDPPELFAEFLRLWEDGYKVVYGIRRRRPSESFLLRRSRRLYYRLVDFLSEERLPHDAGDFRLIDRCVIDQLKRVSDQQPYLRGLIAAMGFRQTGIVYDRSVREHGESKFNLWKLISLGLDGILHHSIIPLRIATLVGLGVSTLAVLAAIYYFLARIYSYGNWPQGFASTTIIVLLSMGLNALLLGIIGEYIGRIYKNVKLMPVTIIEATIDHGRAADPVVASSDAIAGGVRSAIDPEDAPRPGRSG